MLKFLSEDFLLTNDTAKKLYHNYAEKMPIVDYHCHLNPQEIAENKHYDNITQVWLGGDHYKWRIMRANGVEERFITGDASDREKFQKWAETLEAAIGNPLYQWSHLELKRYFGYEGVLNRKTAEEVWQLCNRQLSKEDMCARDLIQKSGVKVICTTDDPADTLEWHKQIKDDSSFPVKVLPTWRPDSAMGIEKDSFVSYVEKLGNTVHRNIDNIDQFLEALDERIEFFAEMGCRVSDHGLDYVMYEPSTREEVNDIFRKALNNIKPSYKEALRFKTFMLLHLGRQYHRLGWAMQLHYGVKRNNNTRMFNKLGPDTGYDCISNYTPSSQLADFLNALDMTDELPKTIVYSLNPEDNTAIGSVIGCFQQSDTIGKIQHGSAWWFNDHQTGMKNQMSALAAQGLLGNFVGMLTDSRSFISYTRHEYFRRVMCDLIGTWVENGEYPDDDDALQRIIEGICYKNAVRYFEFGGDK